MMSKLSVWILFSASAICGSLCLLSPRVEAAGEITSKKVIVGLPKSLFRDAPEPVVQLVMRPFKVFLEAQTGSASEVVLSLDAQTLGQQLKEDKVQIAVFNGFEFAWAQKKHPQLKPLVLAVNEQPLQRAYLIVRQDCKAESCFDLKDQILAYPKLSRDHCKLFMDYRCVKTGMTSDKFYSQVATPDDSEDALDSVVEGTAQAAIIDGIALEAYKASKPGRAKLLKTLLQSEAFPSAVIAYNPGAVNEAAVERFRLGLINARTSAQGRHLLEMCRITSFEALPADYDQVFTNIVKAYPPPLAK